MNLLDRYLVRNMSTAIVRILVALVLLFVVIDLLTHRQDSIIKYEIPWLVVLEYYAAFTPRILFEYQAIPLAVLVAALMTLGRAAQDNEITAALAGGISLRRLALGPLVLAGLIGVCSFFAQETIGARATADANRIENEYFSRFALDRNKGVSWNALENGWMCNALIFNRVALTGQDVYLHRIADDKLEEIRAHRIWWNADEASWMLEDGIWLTFDRTRGWEQQAQRITQARAPFRESPEVLFALEAPANTKSALLLRDDIHRAEALGTPVHGQWVELHAKFARPALCFVMALVAIPFAMRVRRGGVVVGFGLSIVIGLTYVLFFYGGLGLGYLQLLPASVAAWAANVIFLAAGLGLLAKTPT